MRDQDIQKIIDNHYMRFLRKSSSSTLEEHEQHEAAMVRFEDALISDGRDLALDYITAPIDERYTLTSMYNHE